MSELPYRPNVGAVLFNRNGLVFVARRADLPDVEGPPGGWQLPQGGIDPGEDPRSAVLRELAEEVGYRPGGNHRRASRMADLRSAALFGGSGVGGALSWSAPAVVRAPFFRGRCGYPARSGSTSGIRCVALGRTQGTPGAGYRFQARHLRRSDAVVRAVRVAKVIYRRRLEVGTAPEILHLAHLRASQINGCSPCVDGGVKHAKGASETDERVFTVAAWRDAPYFSDAERAAMALAEAMTRVDDRRRRLVDAAACTHCRPMELGGPVRA